MLKVTLGVALLVIIALIGYRTTFTRAPGRLGELNVFLTGAEFILIGVALGGELLDVLDAATLRSLAPLSSMGLGFVVQNASFDGEL